MSHIVTKYNLHCWIQRNRISTGQSYVTWLTDARTYTRS